MRRFTTMTVAIALLGLTACNEQTISTVQTAASVAGLVSADVLPPEAVSLLKGACAANAPALAIATTPGMPASVADTASYPAAYCQQLAASPPGQVPSTTNSGTPSWLPGALATAGAVAKAAAVILPLVL